MFRKAGYIIQAQVLSLTPGIQRIVFTDADRETKELTAADAKASSVAIRELAVERLEPSGHDMGLFSSAFVNRNSTETRDIRNMLANLTKLRFILTKQLVGRRWKKKPVAGLLAQARNLEILFLERRHHTSMDLQGTAPMITGFQGLLERCSFPMLKTFYLSGVNARAKEIKNFLESTVKLQNLVIVECQLHEGLWESVADQIEEHRCIEEAHLDKLRGGFPGFEGLQWTDKFCGFEDFFYSGAPNPFSYARLKIYEQDIRDQRAALKDPLSENSDYYYGKWFITEVLPWKGFQETLS
ncbi:MAG: hypothetical protein Q9195_002933 [Heterodermia aff. obscurata]